MKILYWRLANSLLCWPGLHQAFAFTDSVHNQILGIILFPSIFMEVRLWSDSKVFLTIAKWISRHSLPGGCLRATLTLDNCIAIAVGLQVRSLLESMLISKCIKSTLNAFCWSRISVSVSHAIQFIQCAFTITVWINRVYSYVQVHAFFHSIKF